MNTTAIDWTRKAAELAELALRRSEGASDLRTAANLFEELRRQNHSLRVEDGALCISPRPPAELVEGIRRLKPELLILAGPRLPEGLRNEEGRIDWRQEWAWERDLLLRRAAAATDPEIKGELLRMSEMEISNAEDWQGKWFLVAGLEEKLRTQGVLPRVVWNE